MSEMEKVNGRWEYTAYVVAGTSDVLYPPRLAEHKPASIGVSPGAGGTVLVEYTLASRAAVEADPNAVTWRPWPIATTSIDSDDVLDSPVTALRVTANIADASWEVLL